MASMDGQVALVTGGARGIGLAISNRLASLPDHPGSPMGELADTWSAAGRPNLWGQVPEVVELQSEAGAAGVPRQASPNGDGGADDTRMRQVVLTGHATSVPLQRS